MSENQARPIDLVPEAPALTFVAEDHPDLLDFEVLLLKDEKIPFRTFNSAETALAAFQEASPRPKLIISDYQMGKMSGLELLERAKKLDPNTKTMLVSGTVNQDFISKAMFKVDCFMEKPFDIPDFVTAVKSLIGNE